MNSIERKFQLLMSLGFRKSLYVWLYRLFNLFEGAYKRYKKVYAEKRWHTKMYNFKKNHKDIFEKKLTKNEQKRIKKFYEKYGLRVSDDWHLLYSRVNGFFSDKYIPETLFYQEIEPVLNKYNRIKVYGEKNLYQKIYPLQFQPNTLLRCMNNHFFNEKYEIVPAAHVETFLAGRDGLYVIKPSIDSFGGRNIYLAEIKNSKILIDNSAEDIHSITERYSGNFIIQYYVHQHEKIHLLNPSSLNTVRIITLRLHENIHVLSSFLRLGNNDSIVDNMTSCGMGIGIDIDGKFTEFGIDIMLNRVENFPPSIGKKELTHYPFFDIIKETVTELHTHTPDFNLVSWDMVINDRNQPIMIESNLRMQDSLIHQALNGPLFGDLTDDVLAEVVRRKKKGSRSWT